MKKRMTLRKSEDDDLMLEELKEVTGIKTKAPALLKAGYSYIELLKKHEALEGKYIALSVDNEKMKQAIKKRAEYSAQLKKQDTYLDELAN